MPIYQGFRPLPTPSDRANPLGTCEQAAFLVVANHRAGVGRHSVARGAQQIVDRLAEHPACQIPQCQVHPGQVAIGQCAEIHSSAGAV